MSESREKEEKMHNYDLQDGTRLEILNAKFKIRWLWDTAQVQDTDMRVNLGILVQEKGEDNKISLYALTFVQIADYDPALNISLIKIEDYLISIISIIDSHTI